jgi:hypothetical protein
VTELGVRVPLIVRCPSKVKAGVVSRELVSVADIFPTLMELAGGELPAGHVLDGKSLVPTLCREDSPRHREWLFSYLGPSRIVRDERYVLEVPGGDRPNRLLDGGDSRSGTDYADVSDSNSEGAVAARDRFAAILKELPGPEGHAGLKQPQKGGKAKQKAKQGKRKAKQAG